MLSLLIIISNRRINIRGYIRMGKTSENAVGREARLVRYEGEGLTLDHNDFIRESIACIQIDKMRCYPVLQAAIFRLILNDDMGFFEPEVDQAKIDELLNLLREHYGFAHLTNHFFWENLCDGAEIGSLRDALAIIIAIKKLLLLQPDHEIIQIINLYRPGTIRENTTFTCEDGIAYCGDETIDARCEELIRVIAESGEQSDHTIRDLAESQANELLEMYGYQETVTFSP